MTIPGVRSTLGEDFYVLLVGWEPIAANGATFKIYLNPLINLVWLGGLVFIIGTLVAAWLMPTKRNVTLPNRSARWNAPSKPHEPAITNYYLQSSNLDRRASDSTPS